MQRLAAAVQRKERERKDKKPFQKESVQLNETFTCVNVPIHHEEKTYENQARLDLSLTSIERLKNKNKFLKTLVEICDEKEHELKRKLSV